MYIRSHLNLFPALAQFSLVSMAMVLACNCLIVTATPCDAAEPAAAQDDESDDWMFDKSNYTNNPKTGHRVDQYKREKTAYRDPNAWFNSPTGDFLFDGGAWNDSPYGIEPFYYYGMWPEIYSQYYFGDDGSGYYPYDGDPND
jgi:hypothetical protein